MKGLLRVNFISEYKYKERATICLFSLGNKMQCVCASQKYMHGSCILFPYKNEKIVFQSSDKSNVMYGSEG